MTRSKQELQNPNIEVGGAKCAMQIEKCKMKNKR
jgi:hypothetical protein